MTYLILAAVSIALGVMIFLSYFYRDPKRSFEGNEDMVLSPADGRVKYIRKVEKGSIPIAIKGRSRIPVSEIAKTDLFNADCWVIGIVMSIFDVHVNRAPIGGGIILNKHVDGKFLSLKKADSDIQNERAVIVIKNKSLMTGVILIASRLVRRVESFVREGQAIQRGAKIGRIVFGSQADIILPADCELLIREGMHISAGVSPIARVKN